MIRLRGRFAVHGAPGVDRARADCAAAREEDRRQRVGKNHAGFFQASGCSIRSGGMVRAKPFR